MEFAGDLAFESIFTSRKVTNLFESLSKVENILETELFCVVDEEIILPYYAETFELQDCAVCYFTNFYNNPLFIPYISVFNKNKIHLGCKTEFPPPRFNRKTYLNIPQRYIRMNVDDIHYVFNLLSVKKELRIHAVCDFLSCFDDFSFYVEGKRIADFVGRYLGEYRKRK